MTRRARIAVAIAMLCAITAAFWLQRAGPTAMRTAVPTMAEPSKPALALLTSLPLLFGEEFSIDGGGSAALARLESRYRVVPVSIADAASLARQDLLLMAHPRAQPAEVLVELDAWVRRGGRVVLLADPQLEWPSERPLGDRLRPPPTFADTGLLAHWGLRLEGPAAAGPRVAKTDNGDILTAAPGRLTARSPNCKLLNDGLVARCDVGRGAATIIADADFLNVAGPAALDGPVANNLAFLMRELRRLESR